MNRVSKHTLKYNTEVKNDQLDLLFNDYRECLIHYIYLIQNSKLPLRTNLSSKLLPDHIIKHSQWKQIIYKNASEIVRSSIKRYMSDKYKRYKKIYKLCINKNKLKIFTDKKFSELDLKINLRRLKFNIENIIINLDNRLFNIKNDSKEFDEFIRIRLPNLNKINVPIKYHKHSLKFNGWNRKNTIQLLSNQYGYFIGIIHHKDEPDKRQDGKTIGIDQGYNKLLTISDGNQVKCIDYDKIVRKIRGSKAYKNCLIDRNNIINHEINKLKLDNVREIVIEELKPQVKRIKNYSKDFKNKRQYWVYGKVVKKLELFSQENGILLTKVDPSYTSQQCSKCGSIHKNNRSNEQFLCISCGYEEDADFNAALNLSTMGTYSSHTTIN